eukprot:scaffold3819_cov107-Isochrysis_galbana.AAC.1
MAQIILVFMTVLTHDVYFEARGACATACHVSMVQCGAACGGVCIGVLGCVKKKLSVRSASGRMRRDTLLSPGRLALPPFPPPPFTISPGARPIYYLRCMKKTTPRARGGVTMAPLQLRLEPTEVVLATDKGAARARVDSTDESSPQFSESDLPPITITDHFKIKSAIAAWRDLTRLTQHGRVMLANFMIYSRPRYWAQAMLPPGEGSEDGPSLESNQRPWLEESPLPRIEVASAPKTINLRRNKWQTYSVGADGIRKWTPVNEGLGALLIREMGRGRGVGRTGRGSGRGSNIQRSSIVEEDETPVEEDKDKESPRIQEIDKDAADNLENQPFDPNLVWRCTLK